MRTVQSPRSKSRVVAVALTASVVLSLAPAALAQFGGPVAVRAEPVERRAWEISQPLVASVEPVTQTTLAAEQPGLVLERMFDDGSTVGKNQVLVRLDTALLKREREAAEAARQALAAGAEQAKVRAENSQREADRLKGLLQLKNAPEKEFRDALTTARVDAATVSIRTAELAQKVAEVARLDEMIRKSEVRSPFADAVVAKRYVEVGQWIKQGDPVADVVLLDPVFVRTNVPEYVIAKVKKGDEARLTFDALPGKTFTGTVEQIIPTADPNSRTFPVKVLLKNPDRVFQPGFFARATLLATTEAKQFVVPRDAVIAAGNQSRVVAVREGKAVVVPVVRAGAEGDKVAVTGALEEKDLVVTRGNENLRGGETLMVQNAAPPPAAGASGGPPSKTGTGS
ncbi:MAG TPA: efflux RND transporter periplasmic adaptor subunit [Tepidisphaeraceae bacterium]|nr:efflux RND transporter periplasmic adaptor subunit [Tepidisphaeraceae bacterium]